MLMVYLSVRKKGLSVIGSLLLLAPLGYIVASFEGSRPNQMTFFFLAAFLYLIEDISSKRLPRFPAVLYLLPILMLFWANMHGGFIFGAAIAAYRQRGKDRGLARFELAGQNVTAGARPLIALLENDPEWRLVFYFKNCLLYTREKSLKAFPKIAAYAIAMESAYASLGDDPRPYLTIARTNLGLGRWKDATDILREDTGLP